MINNGIYYRTLALASGLALSACGGGQSTTAPSPGGSSTFSSNSSFSSSSSNSSSSSSSSSSGNGSSGGMLGMIIEAESLNADVSKLYEIEDSPSFTNIGFLSAGSALCYDDIDLTGVRSVDFNFARDGSTVPTNGRFAILAGGPDPLMATNLGGKITTDSGGWTQYTTLSVGLEEQFNQVTQLCIFGSQGGGIMNLDYFTLSDQTATNDGVTNFDLGLPSGPAVAPITTQNNQVLFRDTPGSIAGMSLFWSAPSFGVDAFYNESVVKWLKDDWNAELVRAAMA